MSENDQFWMTPKIMSKNYLIIIELSFSNCRIYKNISIKKWININEKNSSSHSFFFQVSLVFIGS